MDEIIIEKDIQPKDGTLEIEKRCIVKGSVLGGSIISTSDIIIHGTVLDGNLITSGGNITVAQGIEGDASNIEAFGDIHCNYSHGGNITSKNGSVYVKNRVSNCTIIAKNLVHVKDGDGVIEKSTVEAGIEVISNLLGNEDKDPTYIILSNQRQQELFELILIYDQKLKDKKKRMAKLLKVIQIIKLLGEKVSKLPPKKREELALQVKEYNQIKREIMQTNEEKNKVIKRNNEIKMYTRAIIVNETVHPQVKIIIDKLEHSVVNKYKKVIFYKTGMIIMGDLDQFKLRQR